MQEKNWSIKHKLDFCWKTVTNTNITAIYHPQNEFFAKKWKESKFQCRISTRKIKTEILLE